jgi:hypothetical protein
LGVVEPQLVEQTVVVELLLVTAAAMVVAV